MHAVSKYWYHKHSLTTISRYCNTENILSTQSHTYPFNKIYTLRKYLYQIHLLHVIYTIIDAKTDYHFCTYITYSWSMQWPADSQNILQYNGFICCCFLPCHWYFSYIIVVTWCMRWEGERLNLHFYRLKGSLASHTI